MGIIRQIEQLLNSITMYKLVLWGLRILAGVGILFAFTGHLSMSWTAMLLSLAALSVSCYVTDKFLGWAWGAPRNVESYAITLLILFLILPPATTPARFLGICLAGVLAMSCKYLLARHAKHFFNPAAFAALVLGVTGLLHARWWVGSEVMLPFVVLLGLLVVWKIRRWSLVGTFLLFSLSLMLGIGLAHDQTVGEILKQSFTSWPLIFFATIMLTEPATLPPQRREQVVYGALVGVVFASQVHIGPVAATPELALILGNIYSYAISPKYKLRLRLKHKHQLAPNIYDFAFEPDRTPHFKPGQYMDWTLPHAKVDERGNRRSFSIASAPGEKLVHIGVKFYEPSSSFKQALRALQPGDTLVAGGLAGDFVLPADAGRKLAFIAGGIGITPFRSMLAHLVQTGETRDIVLFYMVNTPADAVYDDVLQQAAERGVRVVRVSGTDSLPAGWEQLKGPLTADFLRKHLPDYAQRTLYISGPNAMVVGGRAVARSLGVGPEHIVTDYFAGY